MTYPRFLPVGDTALTVEFGDAIAPELSEAVMAFDFALAAAELDGIVETVPSYRSLLVCYDPSTITFRDLVSALSRITLAGVAVRRTSSVLWSVPVVYDPPYASDLQEVADRLGLSEQMVVDLHVAAEYRVYMLGFAPGLPYLGGLPDALYLSRRQVPRQNIPVGAVMIGGLQAAIIPISLMSAWYILGRTPLRPFDPGRENPFLFRAGDRIRFRRIDESEYHRLLDLSHDEILSIVRTGP